jgi:predicted DNA-binding protein YlxM (UPF0122 family)
MRKINIDKEILEDLYINKRLSISKIAKQFKVSDSSVLNRMKEFGIKTRSRIEALKGRRFSEEAKKKMSEAQKGEKHPMYGKHFSEERKKKISEAEKGKYVSEKTRKKISESQKGEKNSFYGRQHTEKTKKKMSESLKGNKHPNYGKYGVKSPKWKGGRKIALAKTKSKRRQLGFKLLNKPFEGSEAHHLQDKETVIYIPKELHRRVSHNNWTGKGMNTIDALALDYLELQILGEKEYGKEKNWH